MSATQAQVTRLPDIVPNPFKPEAGDGPYVAVLLVRVPECPVQGHSPENTGPAYLSKPSREASIEEFFAGDEGIKRLSHVLRCKVDTVTPAEA